ncbi:MAG: hypothetical protein H7337_01625 [Rhizobacter sp.]|nr:hypothetical protein [Rhizobacter sp.]
MTRILAATLLLVLAGCVAVEAVRPAATPAAIDTTPPGFDIAMPAPQEPLDTTPITAVETVGAAHNE